MGYRTTRRQIKAKQRVSEWQLIDPDVKPDGEVLLLSKNGIRVARWEPCSMVGPGWFIPLNTEPYSGGTFAANPTHWMPLPARPSADEN